MWTCPKCNEPLEDQFDSCWKCAGKPQPIGLSPGSEMKDSSRQILSGVLLAIGLIPTTWFFFGPIAGFHHMIGFGPTFYLMLNGEDAPQPGDHMWGEYVVRFFPGRFVIGFALWLAVVFAIFKVVRFLTKRQHASLDNLPETNRRGFAILNSAWPFRWSVITSGGRSANRSAKCNHLLHYQEI
jgi:hypothetical protein